MTDDDWRAVIRTDRGRAVLWDIMKRFNLMESLDYSDSFEMQRRLGGRDAAVYIYNKFMKLEPEKFNINEGMNNER